MKLRIFFFCSLLVLASCQNDNTAGDAKNNANVPEKITVQVPRFDRDTAYQFIADQLAFGPRVVNSEGHREMKEWLVERMRSFGATVIEQPFQATAHTGETLHGTNVIAQYNPGTPNRIILAAHWDTRPFADSPINTERVDEPILGADDGASGVAVLMEIARQLQANPIDLGVDIIFFDAEDYGKSTDAGASEEEQRASIYTFGLGAQHWSRNKHTGSSYQYGILLDMVGARNAYFPKEEYSRYFAGPVVEKIWSLAQSMGYANYFADAEGGGVTDDHFFVNSIAGIPMIDIINMPPNSGNKSFADHWHTHDDDLDIIDKRTLRAVGQVVLAVLYNEFNGSI